MKQKVSTVKAEFSSEKVNVKEQRINKAKGLKIRKKLNRNWQSVEKTSRYRKAVVRAASKAITSWAEDELMDGIFLTLKKRNQDKSWNIKHRLVRRILEKRQAQVAHRVYGHTEDRFMYRTVSLGTSQSYKAIRDYQRAI